MNYKEAFDNLKSHYYLVIIPSIKQKNYEDAVTAIGILLPMIREVVKVPETKRTSYFNIVKALEELQVYLGNTVTFDGITRFTKNLESYITDFDSLKDRADNIKITGSKPSFALCSAMAHNQF